VSGTAPPERQVGPLVLTLGADEAAAFADALGSQRPGWVPLIFPARWLALPAIRAAVAELADLANGLALHETQSFEIDAPLLPNAAYTFTATIRRLSENPPRLIVQAVVATADGIACVRFQAGLRIVPRTAPP